MNNMDVSMSEAPGDGGDDDSHSNTHGKPGGADPERNVKRTKNDGDLNDDKGASKSPQKSNTKTVAMHMMKHASVGGLEKNSSFIPKPKDAPSAVMDDFSEGAPVKDHSMVYVPKSVITGGEEGSTSIASVHGTRASRHAEAGRAATEAAVTSARPSGPAAAAGGPAVPRATGAAVTPSRPMPATPCSPTALPGGSALPRHGMHGPASPMQPATSIKSTSIKPINPPMSFLPDKGMCTQGVRMEKNKIFSNDQIVDFGGIKEEALRGVRSSGRLRAQPNYDATQLERATMVPQKRDAMPVIGYPTGCSLDSTMGFPPSAGVAGGYGYWVQPDAGGCSGLLFPGYWVATS